MKKKKLSLQQQKNMVSARSQRQDQYEKIIQGIVITQRGKTIDCLADDQTITLKNSRTFDLVVGDQITLGLSAGKDPEILIQHPRKNSLERFTNEQATKCLAANIDLAIVVIAPEPTPWPQILAQYATHLANLNIDFCFILNKKDLLNNLSEITERLSYFDQNLNVPVLYTSTKTKEGLDSLKTLISGKKSIIIGPSGAGKSSLIKKLLNADNILVGDLSSTQKGQHTTSVTQLYFLDDKTGIIDSPGIRQLAMEKLTINQLLNGFPDFRKAGCKFKDCDHITSGFCELPHCLKTGIIAKSRYEDYLFLRNKFVLES